MVRFTFGAFAGALLIASRNPRAFLGAELGRPWRLEPRTDATAEQEANALRWLGQ